MNTQLAVHDTVTLTVSRHLVNGTDGPFHTLDIEATDACGDRVKIVIFSQSALMLTDAGEFIDGVQV